MKLLRSVCLLAFFSSSIASAATITLETASYEDINSHCSKAKAAKPAVIFSKVIPGVKGSAQTMLHCWRGKENATGYSQLAINGKKAYEAHIDKSITEADQVVILNPLNWSPDGSLISFLSEQVQWATEPGVPLLYFHNTTDGKTFVFDRIPIKNAIWKQFPKAKQFLQSEYELVVVPTKWKNPREVEMAVEIFCYGCCEIPECDKLFETISMTRWLVKPDGTVLSFLGKGK